MLLGSVRTVVPAQAIVERQFAGDLPGVLKYRAVWDLLLLKPMGAFTELELVPPNRTRQTETIEAPVGGTPCS